MFNAGVGRSCVDEGVSTKDKIDLPFLCEQSAVCVVLRDDPAETQQMIGTDPLRSIL